MAPSCVWTLPGTPQREWDVTAVRHEADDAVDQSLEELDERALVDACLAGRAGAFDLIVERHRRHVYQLCYRFVSNHEDASDLSQDVFVRAYRGTAEFSRPVVVGNLAVSHRRQRLPQSRQHEGAATPSRSTNGSTSIRASNPRPITCSKTSARRASGRRLRSCRASSARR